MKAMNIVNAVNDALDIKLTEDKSVVVYGEDVGFEGGVFRVTEGLQKKHGVERVFDSPLAESGIAGTAVGMAAAGLRPVIEMQFCGFIYPAFNQIISHVSRFHNRSRGKYRMPIVIRLPMAAVSMPLSITPKAWRQCLPISPDLKWLYLQHLMMQRDFSFPQ